MSDSDDEFYTVPLKDQRYFGAGVKRQRVHFVKSSTHETPAAVTGVSTASPLSASERYLTIVFPKSHSEPPISSKSAIDSSATAPQEKEATICDVCKTPIEGDQATHCTSLVHQIALPHAHPPSALDRSRKGLSILRSCGWDPDERRGLGAQREGILHPIKPKEKRDTLGLGVDFDNNEPTLKKKKKPKEKPKVVERLDAGKIRKLEQENKKKNERLQRLFYANDDVEKYLGAG